MDHNRAVKGREEEEGVKQGCTNQARKGGVCIKHKQSSSNAAVMDVQIKQ